MLLITGSDGQLGTELSRLLPNALLADADALDVADAGAVADFAAKNDIDSIINCAAYTAVDKAEDDRDLCARVNADGPRHLAKTGAKIIHISTDYVFDGQGHKPYAETDAPRPLSVYGKTKLAGEAAVLDNAPVGIVIRTSWLYSAHGNNFVKTMRRLGAEKDTLNVVADQIGTPTFAGDLARVIADILPQLSPDNKGIYHYSNEGVCSWYDFACEIMALSGLKCAVNPIPTSAYPAKAARPFYSVLDKSKIKSAFGVKIPHWKESLKKCIRENMI